MKKLIIFIIGMVLFSYTAYAQIYDWVIGVPANTNNRSEWVTGVPFKYINGTIETGEPAADTTPPTYSDTQKNISTYLSDSAYQINRTATDATGVAWCNFSTNLTAGQTWVNYSNQSFTGSPVKAQINISTPSGWEAGDEIGFMVSCCDEVATPNCGADIEFTYTLTTMDTCSCPASGDWNIDCSDNCVISEDCNMQGNDIHTYGSGTLEVNALIYNFGSLFNRCDLFCRNTPTCFG